MIVELLKNLFDEPTLETRPCQQLAGIALLVEVAMADGQLDETERQALVNALAKSHKLGNTEIEHLITQATEHQDKATSVYEFTRVINDEFSQAEKFELVQAMWAVAYADGNLDKYEEHTIRKLAELIHVSHSDFIRAKLAEKAGS
ncbi:TerB family tellurite resistance protein [Simiduia sp. 21SJ11W-1]|uniref:tellurite resistance TerB family protein n=1 Tax=Simiduia sp. 21SJ11W-1 TaxID=2909669 RepID=UPI00209E8171|nr:TerB family tellurite resistance protein [Simiduia sp. 21SJ11W-1]UTA48990.1 TerB family tellurite resistance protein [Simiduia sp. 21SJ11W-1]